MIISILNRASGFYSQFFFTLNHYLYAKKIIYFLVLIQMIGYLNIKMVG